jgi:cell division protein FtsN
MRDYKEHLPKGGGGPRPQKRGQGKRLFGIMAGMIVAFAIFMLGIKVGIQVERERVRIVEEVPATQNMNRDKKEATEKNAQGKTAAPVDKKDEKMQFTFYDTLTRKEGGEQSQQKVKAAQAGKEHTTVAEKKSESPAKAAKVAASTTKELYFVQIASFKEKERAEGLKGKLTKKGYTVQLLPTQVEGKGLWYRVRVGGYASLKEAQAIQKKITVEEKIEGTKVVSGS